MAFHHINETKTLSTFHQRYSVLFFQDLRGTITNTSQGAQNQILKLGLLPSHEDLNQCLHSMSAFNYGEQLCRYIDRASEQLLGGSF